MTNSASAGAAVASGAMAGDGGAGASGGAAADRAVRAAVVLPGWLTVPQDTGLDAVAWNTGDPVPETSDLARAEVFVLPYMAPVEVAALSAKMPRLRVAQTLTAGVEGIAEHLAPGVVLCNAPGVHDASTAELAVGLMIAAQRGLDIAARDMAEGTWRHVRRPSLADSTVLVVGWGGVGQAIGRRLAGFEVDVVPVASRARPASDGAADGHSAADGAADEHGAAGGHSAAGGAAGGHDAAAAAAAIHGVDELDDLLPSADIVVLAVPLTDDTHRLLDARRLALLPDGALVVNVARGRVVDTDALTAEVTSGRLRAALDVTDPEPLPQEHPLWRAPGVLITSHLGGNSQAFPPRAQRFLDAQLRRYAAGEPLVGVRVPAGGSDVVS